MEEKKKKKIIRSLKNVIRLCKEIEKHPRLLLVYKTNYEDVLKKRIQSEDLLRRLENE